jgi:hypothetical protein
VKFDALQTYSVKHALTMKAKRTEEAQINSEQLGPAVPEIELTVRQICSGQTALTARANQLGERRTYLERHGLTEMEQQ